jgi:hypothetical protein
MFINVANGTVSPWNITTRGPSLNIASVNTIIPGTGFNNAVHNYVRDNMQYLDDVVEGKYHNATTFYIANNGTITNTAANKAFDKIYSDINSKKIYRWGGTAYAEISSTIALGTTNSTASRGDHKHTATLDADFSGSIVKTENATIKPAGTVNVTHSLAANHTHTFTGTAANHNHTFNTSGSTSAVNAAVSGTINASFAGTNKAISVSGTPAGTISKPSITVTPSTVNANAVVTKAGTRSTLTQSYNNSTKTLTLNFTTGSNTTMNNSIKLMTGATAVLAANPAFTGTLLTSTGYYTPEGAVTVSHSLTANHSHTFNKSFTTNNTSITPVGNIATTNATVAGTINATFNGTEINHSHNVTAAGSISGSVSISTPV